jgi:hypothetical protein
MLVDEYGRPAMIEEVLERLKASQTGMTRAGWEIRLTVKLNYLEENCIANNKCASEVCLFQNIEDIFF